MAETVDLLPDLLLSLNMICSLDTQQEIIFGKTMIDTNRRSYRRQYTSKVFNHCGKTRHIIDTCYKNHGFLSQFKLKKSQSRF